MIPFAIKFGRRLRKLRDEAGLLARELADGAGIDRSYVSHMEAGRYLPQLDLLEPLARALGVEVIDLVTFPKVNVRHRLIERMRHSTLTTLERIEADLDRAESAGTRSRRQDQG